MKVGRNKPCHCGSGKKFKRCHGKEPVWPSAAEVAHAMAQSQARERIRQTQQGLGKGIISANFKGQQVVAVGNTVYFSPQWKTFPDFLLDYLKAKLTPEWLQSEAAKPEPERHTIAQWGLLLFSMQRELIRRPGEPTLMSLNGVMACYYGLAYGLYLMDHNVELQARLVHRLKDPGNFQGAYYEVLVASALIRAGFELTLEDETDGTSKHCEFAAVSKATGKCYWIEAKMRAVTGLLGRTAANGMSDTKPATSQLVKHLNGAFAKPAADERMIFVDLNSAMSPDATEDNPPAFVDHAKQRLARYQRESLPKGETAYVFITNIAYHRCLDGPATMCALPFGMGISDFNRTGAYRLSEIYRRDRLHQDAFRVAESLSGLQLPTTFDGALAATALLGQPSPVVIGEKYCFERAGPDGKDLVAEVTSAIVDEKAMCVVVAVAADGGGNYILKEPISEAQLSDYKAHPDAYFGKVVRPPKMANTPYELFQFLMDAYKDLSREQILSQFAGRVPGADAMEDEELRAIYCEGRVAALSADRV